MSKIRVFLVDDSVVIRQMLKSLLEGEADIEVAGMAPNGRVALERLEALNPDIVISDVEMPEMDGLAFVKEAHARWPRLPILMFSSVTEKGALVTVEALSRGAADYVMKPNCSATSSATFAEVRDHLLPKLRAICAKAGSAARRDPVASATSAARPTLARPAISPTRRPIVDVVAIGVSTGGPKALAKVLGDLPATLSVPVVIVQHMPPVFTKSLAESLNHTSALTVVEAAEGDRIVKGTVYIAPGGFHMTVAGTMATPKVSLNQAPPENSCRPSVDVLFRSVARAFGSSSLAVVLTGMGKDGLVGAQRIRAAGGQIVAQDEATSVVWGMPGYVAEAGIADAILPLDDVATEIVRRVRRDAFAPATRERENLLCT